MREPSADKIPTWMLGIMIVTGAMGLYFMLRDMKGRLG